MKEPRKNELLRKRKILSFFGIRLYFSLSPGPLIAIFLQVISTLPQLLLIFSLDLQLLFLSLLSFSTVNLIVHILLYLLDPGFYEEETPPDSMNAKAKDCSMNEPIGRLFMEQNYCGACLLDQPIRCRHCSHCQKCVLTFDHHCFFLGNCIGEKNRPIFFTYITMKSCEAAVFLIFAWKIRSAYLSLSWPIFCVSICSLAILAIAFLNLTYLIGFHLFLMFNNLTTWEFFSWNKISYLKEFKYAEGSPFSTSVGSNLKKYWFPNGQKHFLWKPYRFLPKEQTSLIYIGDKLENSRESSMNSGQTLDSTMRNIQL